MASPTLIVTQSETGDGSCRIFRASIVDDPDFLQLTSLATQHGG